MDLKQFFRENPRVALGFSGGVDSSYLLWAARTHGAEVGAYYIKTAFQPAFELEDARRLAGDIGAEITVIEADVLSFPMVGENPENRCYYCKTALFSLLKKWAEEDGYSCIIDGTNASDNADDRPGMKALRELAVKSPLRECGITKEEVRRRSKEAGLFTHDKPAYACLATRIPAGRRITEALLERVEAAEEALFALGFSDFRVRLYGDAARLQLSSGQMARALAEKQALCKALAPYFQDVFLDISVFR